MPLNRPALKLGPGPRGVRDARRWVIDSCLDIGRPELAECAELAVSELVTNALLHGEPPISVRVRGTREHPRVEVRDVSLDPPVLPTETLEAEQPEDVLLTVGRGLSIVARCSDAWGAEIEDDGKVAWFAPAASYAATDGPAGVITGVNPRRAARRSGGQDPLQVQVLGVPVAAYIGFQQHFRELRREVRLLALAHQSDYPLAKSLSDLFGSLERQLRDGMGIEQVEAAAARGEEYVDIVVRISRSSARTLNRFIQLLDLADEFCREERLLSLARTRDQQRFQAWFLCEFVRQSKGEPPHRWMGVKEDSCSVGG